MLLGTVLHKVGLPAQRDLRLVEKDVLTSGIPPLPSLVLIGTISISRHLAVFGARGMLLIPGQHIHAFAVKLFHRPREIENIELVFDIGPKILHTEIEPISVALRVRINLHEKVVVLAVVDVRRV